MEEQGPVKREMGSRFCVVLGRMARVGFGGLGETRPAGPEGRDLGAGRYLGLFVLLAPCPGLATRCSRCPPRTPLPPVLRGSKATPIISGWRKHGCNLTHPHTNLCFRSLLSAYCLDRLLFWLPASQLRETMLWARASQRQGQ